MIKFFYFFIIEYYTTVMIVGTTYNYMIKILQGKLHCVGHTPHLKPKKSKLCTVGHTSLDP